MDNKKFVGSGILLLEKHQNNYKIILMNSIHNKYEDFGGGLENNGLWENATKESLEESSGYLDFSEIKKPSLYIDYKYKHDNIVEWYRCFIICIENNIIKKSLFNQNLKILKNKNYNHTFLEMRLMKRFDLEDFKKYENKNFISRKNKLYEIRNRTKTIIRKILKIKNLEKKINIPLNTFKSSNNKNIHNINLLTFMN